MSLLPSFLQRKPIDLITVHEAGRRLIPTLSWPHLIALGIGAIVGTGIYTLIGVGAEKPGQPYFSRSSSLASSAPAQHWHMPRWQP